MRPYFLPRLVNGPFDDPGVYISFAYQNRALLFDLGEIYSLSSKSILKIDHIFVSHTHMDHFSGFDRLLRLFLGRNKILRLFGPTGFLKNIEGKLNGYQWNLVQNYAYPFSILATEVSDTCQIEQEFRCDQGFCPGRKHVIQRQDGVLVEEPEFTISTAILDHAIPCLAFCLNERFHVNIINEGLDRLELKKGPWLRHFKNALYQDEGGATESMIDAIDCHDHVKTFTLNELKEQICCITQGQKITYVTDVRYSDDNLEKIIDLAFESDYLFIEAAFLDCDEKNAYEKYHLTARQAGDIARRSRSKQFVLFHFSPKNMGLEPLIAEQASQGFENKTFLPNHIS